MLKYLLIIAIAGFSCWLLSEVLEIVQGGYSTSVYYLTSAYHLLAGIGIWGLCLLQPRENYKWLAVGAALASVFYILLTPFPLQLLSSGLNAREFVDANPIYKLVALGWFSGMIIFSVSTLKTGYFPRWASLIMVVGTIVFTVSPILEWPSLLVNANNIIFAGAVLYNCVFGLLAGGGSTRVEVSA